MHHFRIYTSSILLSLTIHTFWKSTSSILLSQKTNTQIKKVYFKYTSELENVWLKFQNLQCLHMATFSLLFQMHFKNRFKVYLKYTSLLNSWLTKSHTFTNDFLNYFPIIFIKLGTLEVKISKSIFEVQYTTY